MEPTNIDASISFQVIGHTKRAPRTNSMDKGYCFIESKNTLANWCCAEKLQVETIASRVDFSKRNLLIIGKETSDSTNFIGIKTVKKIDGIVTVHSGEININSGAPRKQVPGYSAAFLLFDKNICLDRVKIDHQGLFNLSDLDEAECHATQPRRFREIVNRASGPLFQ